MLAPSEQGDHSSNSVCFELAAQKPADQEELAVALGELVEMQAALAYQAAVRALHSRCL